MPSRVNQHASAHYYSEGENSDDYWQDVTKQRRRAGIRATAEKLGWVRDGGNGGKMRGDCAADVSSGRENRRNGKETRKGEIEREAKARREWQEDGERS